MLFSRRGLAAWASSFMICVAVSASGIQREEVIERVQERYEQTRSWEAEFKEVSLNRSLGIEVEKSGRAYFRKPGLMRWEYAEPDKRLIVCDGKKLWMYSPDEGQVLVASVESLYRAHAPILFLTGEGKLAEYFEMDLAQGEEAEAEGELVLELVPIQQQANMDKLRLVVDAGSFQILGTAVYDHFGNVSRIRFCDIRTGGDLPESLFEFSPPPGIEVIEASQFGQER